MIQSVAGHEKINYVGNCSSCEKPAEKLLRCTRCWTVAYCGQACQIKDWNLQHKNICQKKERPPSPKKDSGLDKALTLKAMPIPGLMLIENFIEKDVHDLFVKEVVKGNFTKCKGLYQDFEIESQSFDETFESLILSTFQKLQSIKFFENEKWPNKIHCTILKYDKNGYISKHVDSPLVSDGSVIILSFNTPVVVNFYSEKKGDTRNHKIFVPPRSMYAIRGESRYEWSHEISADEDSFEGKKFERGTRYCILMSPPGRLVHPDALMTVHV